MLGNISPTGGTYMTDDTNPIQSVKRRFSRRSVLKSASAAALVGVAAPHLARAAAMPELDSSFKDFTLPNSSCDESLLKIQHKGEIVVGTSGDWPYSFFPANTTEWTGLDADIIRYVAKMLKIPKITVQTTPFSGLIPGLLDGRFDIVGDSIHWTLGRAKVADFCFPTYYYSEWLAVKKGNPLNIHTFADFKGHTICTELGTNYAEWLGKIEGMNFVTAKDWEDTIQDLVIGRVDGVVYDQPVLAASIKDHPEWSIELASGYEPRTTKNPVGYSRYALRQGDVQLNEGVSAAIQWMQDQQEMSKILTKWNLTGYNN
jgi:polar amino acid transport system substrate-binding protein